MNNKPPLKRCVCGSFYCGPAQCRFEPEPPPVEDEPRDFGGDEIDERLEELREYDRHPERYR